MVGLEGSSTGFHAYPNFQQGKDGQAGSSITATDTLLNAPKYERTQQFPGRYLEYVNEYTI
ncbi:hypothetical protein FACS1894184_20990 [Clostridia bacterium]|nr:hypothetical protein FACS1894184_20990 [Clostridia bacterium]